MIAFQMSGKGGQPGKAKVGNEPHIVVLGMTGTTLWHYHIDLSTNDHSDWEYVSGTTPSKPTLTS